MAEGGVPSVGQVVLSPKYVAGLIDGEGCISIYKVDAPDYKRPKLQLQITVVLREGWLLRYLQNQWGGSLKRYARKVPQQAPVSRWRLGDLAAVPFLRAIEPYLLAKREQANIALHFRASSGNDKRTNPLSQLIREDCYWCLRYANRRGVEKAA